MANTNTIYRKNRLFAKYGHECELANDLDELPTIIPGNTKWANIKRTLIRLKLVSTLSKQSHNYFRSQGAIANEKHRHLRDHPCIIHPFSDGRKWWELFMCPIFLLQFVLIPLDVAYFPIPSVEIYRHKTWKWIRMVLDCLCFIDVWFTFWTGYYNFETKESILAPKKIAVHYLTTFFVPDFFSSIPTHVDLFIDIDVNSDVFLALQLMSILKILRFRTFVRYCKEFFDTFEVSYAANKISLLLIASVLYFHLITCAVIASENGYHVQSPHAHSLTKDGIYSGAFYYAAILISNSGYGMNPPTGKQEILFMIVIWLTSRLLLVILMGRIVELIKAATSASSKYIEMLRQLKQYMRHKQLPEYMQRRLLTYYEFRFQKSYFRESEILSTISGQLRQEIVMHSCRKLVENVAFFKNLPLTLLVRIVSCLRSEIFLINDVIVRANTPGNSMFFIASGTVAVFTSSGREVCHLEDGAHFGEIALVMRDELRVASVIAVEVCELYRLDRKEFVRAIHPYPDLLENIQKIAADRMEKTTMLDEHNRREIASKRLY